MKLKPVLLISGIVLFQLISTSFKSYSITAVVRGTFPSVAAEASGLDFSGTNDYWTLDDAGGSNKIFRVNSTGALKQTVTIDGATNYDWEDLTHNTNRTKMFIGDFGNNYFNRKNLRIYKVPYPTSANTNLTPSVINFSYPDQKKFPSSWKNFDVEAFVYLNENLYLFTKGEGSAIGYTKMYSLPDEPGTYVAKLVDSFYVNTRITGAAISPDGKSLVLISNTQIHLFRNFIGNHFFDGAYNKITISGVWTQKEGVTFSSNTMIYLGEEGLPGKNHLYSVDLTSYIIAPRMAAPVTSDESFYKPKISVYPNPASDYINIRTGENYNHVEIIISNMAGQIVRRIEFETPDQNIRLETEMLPAGVYALRVIKDFKDEESVLISLLR